MNTISICDLTKVYKDRKKALDNLSLSTKQGEIFSLLGSNGAGKSTLINILNTSSKPTSGNVEILGKPITDRYFIRSNIACVSQNISIHSHLTLEENLLFQCRLYHINSTDAKKKIQNLIQDFELEEFKGKTVNVFSGGERRRFDIAMSMVSQPKILFLDEPTVALDIVSRQALWSYIWKIREKYNTTVFLTTHYLEEADKLSDTICIIKNGHQIVQDTPQNLRKFINTRIVKIGVYQQQDIKEVNAILKPLTFIQGIRIEDNMIYSNIEDNKENNKEELMYINKLLMDKGISFHTLELINPSLDDVFLTIIKDSEGR